MQLLPGDRVQSTPAPLTSVLAADLGGDAQRVAQLRLAGAPLPKDLSDLWQWGRTARPQAL